MFKNRKTTPENSCWQSHKSSKEYSACSTSSLCIFMSTIMDTILKKLQFMFILSEVDTKITLFILNTIISFDKIVSTHQKTGDSVSTEIPLVTLMILDVDINPFEPKLTVFLQCTSPSRFKERQIPVSSNQ